jgi:hypothetical protein
MQGGVDDNEIRDLAIDDAENCGRLHGIDQVYPYGRNRALTRLGLSHQLASSTHDKLSPSP